MYKFKTCDCYYTEERALFSSCDLWVDNCEFKDGESPLKESKNIKVTRSTFMWKYPLWYCNDVEVDGVTLKYTARSGIWYTNNLSMRNSTILAPKTFRRCENLKLEDVQIIHADETLWNCDGVKLFKVKARGDYLGFNSKNVEVDGLYLEGNYLFDGGKDIVVRNSTLYSKDSFWNCENVTIINSTIIGEYIGWNSKNVTFINCVIKSHQGFCYMKGVKLINCKIINSDLTFEYSEDIDAEIITEIDSIKNPYSGVIKCKDVKTLILDEKFVDCSKIKVLVDKKDE